MTWADKIWHLLDQYYKQTQLEAMTSEKAAAEFQLEKEIKRIREAQVHYLILVLSYTY